MPLMFLGDCHRFTGHPEDAADRYEEAMKLVGREPILLGRLASAAAEQGNRTAALRLIEELESLPPSRFVLPTIMARVFLSLGDVDSGFAWLDRAVDARDTTLATLPTWPEYDAARPDPRYARLLERVRLWPPGMGPEDPSHTHPAA